MKDCIHFEVCAYRGRYHECVEKCSCYKSMNEVVVVRCKDCKFFHDKGYCTKTAGLSRNKLDDFCSYGERRTDGN